MKQFLLASVLFMMMTPGCGKPTFYSDKDSKVAPSQPKVDGQSLSADAAKKPRTVRAPKEDLDCAGIRLHGEHEACDHEDVSHRDMPTATNELPVIKEELSPAPVENKSAETPAPVKEKAPTPPESIPTTAPQNPPKSPSTEPPVATTPAPTPPAPAPSTPAPSTPAPPTPPQDPNIVEFRIKAGTGSNPWNTPETMVTVKVGQTLRLINDDTVTHRLHTGGAPCPHGTNFGPGQTFDCVVTRALDPQANPGRTYDHIAGEEALFHLKAIP